MSNKEERQQFPKFDYETGEEVEKLAEKYFKETELKLENFLSVSKQQSSFSTTIEKFSTIMSELYNQITPITFMSLVSTRNDIRESCARIKQNYEKFELKVYTNYEIFSTLRIYLEGKEREKEEEDEQARRLSCKVEEDFLRNGLHLPSEEEREEVKKLKDEISEISLQIARNINEENTKIVLSESELTGLPSSFLSTLLPCSPSDFLAYSSSSPFEMSYRSYLEGMNGDRSANASQLGDPADQKEEKYYWVTLAYPHIFPILSHCKNRKTREKMQFAFDSKCDFPNSSLLIRLLRLRLRVARKMGYWSDAEYMLSTKIMKTANQVSTFLDDVSKLLSSKFDDEFSHTLSLLTREEEDNQKMEMWDYKYYQQRRIEEKFSINEEEIRTYFPIESVMEGIFHIYQQLFSLRFEKENAPTWHPSVLCYSVYFLPSSQGEKEEKAGYFYMDLHPREGKYKHAACWPITRRHFSPPSHQGEEKKRVYTASAIVANFTPPSPPKPSLLSFGEVKTFFHEFGHVMHSILSTNRYGRLNWTWSAVEQDFLEVPSMILENWLFDPTVINLLSSKYISPSDPSSLSQQGEKMGEEMIKAISDSFFANFGFSYRRLIAMAKFDLEIHSCDPSILGFSESESADLLTSFLSSSAHLPSHLLPSLPSSFLNPHQLPCNVLIVNENPDDPLHGDIHRDDIINKEIINLINDNTLRNNIDNSKKNNEKKKWKLSEEEEKKVEQRLIDKWDEVMSRHISIDMQPMTKPFASWQHLVTGYNAGYYSYLLSDLISSDLFFSRFYFSPSSSFNLIYNHKNEINEENLLQRIEKEKNEEEKGREERLISPLVGLPFCQQILSPCALLPGETMIRNFLGRDYNPRAFCYKLGLPLPPLTP